MLRLINVSQLQYLIMNCGSGAMTMRNFGNWIREKLGPDNRRILGYQALSKSSQSQFNSPVTIKLDLAFENTTSLLESESRSPASRLEFTGR
jgi:hypothetical protein